MMPRLLIAMFLLGCLALFAAGPADMHAKKAVFADAQTWPSVGPGPPEFRSSPGGGSAAGASGNGRP